MALLKALSLTESMYFCFEEQIQKYEHEHIFIIEHATESL